MLFDKGGVFLPDVSGLVVSKAARAIERIGVLTYTVGHGSGSRKVAASIPQPTDPELASLKQDARNIYVQFKAFFDVNFPLYELTNAYSFMDFDAKLNWADREKLMAAVAIHEKLDPKVCWQLVCH